MVQTASDSNYASKVAYQRDTLANIFALYSLHREERKDKHDRSLKSPGCSEIKNILRNIYGNCDQQQCNITVCGLVEKVKFSIEVNRFFYEN